MSDHSSTAPRLYFASLESLRGLAALMVACYHVAWLHPTYEWGLVRNAYLMVDCFFVLSGFVICHAYGRNRIATRNGLFRFLWLRWGRLYPLHLAFLLVFALFELVQFFGKTRFGLTAPQVAFTNNNVTSLTTNLTLTHGLGIHDHFTFNYPSWSISTEFWAYAVFGLVVIAARSLRRLVVSAAALSLSSFAVLLLMERTTLDGVIMDYGFVRCTMGFFLGVVTYGTFVRFGPRVQNLPRVVSAPVATPILLFAIVFFLSAKSPGWSDFLLLPAVATLIFLLASDPESSTSRLLDTGPLVWLGKVSYSIYMVHAAVIWVLSQALRFLMNVQPAEPQGDGAPPLDPTPLVGSAFFVLAVVAVLLVSSATFRWIEDPFRKWSRDVARGWARPSA